MTKTHGLVLLLATIIVVGCSNNNIESRFVESGFSVNSELNTWLSTAVKAERKQEEKANLTVYAGYLTGFIDKRNSFATNPGYGRFVLQRCVRDKTNNDVSYKYFELPDFYNESKYLITCKEDNDGTSSRIFTFQFEDSILLNEISISEGYICYIICLLDDDNQIIEKGKDLFGGISIGDLFFSKVEKQIFFK